ncbi:hypothetical protein FSP39_014424 [Pinctada imbricata]|uniref:Bcl-2 Bcl-2 homology region 1-3 domain-containing protein n=1 Tax=Pinctada imbricata TaxID=66713 RepID=A0AA88Y5A4_PINIB|nr:hypothetical protein FSP39_014424 [Pinctada imbricata]
MGDQGSGDGRSSSRPSSQQLPSPSQEPLPPDTVDHVVDQAEDVLKNFIYERYQKDLLEEKNVGESTPPAPELVTFTTDPLSRASQVGRQLARIGDDINRRYADEFSSMVDHLNITEDTAYEVFASVARKNQTFYLQIIHEGINWGRVAALMCLAYRIVMKVLKVRDRARQLTDFIRLIISHVVRFIHEIIAGWIASQGGWISVLEYTPGMGLGSMAFVVGSCVLAIAAVVYFSRRS